MKNIKNRVLLLCAIAFVSISCNDILDENPDNRTTIDSPEKIAELLVGAYPEAAYVTFTEPFSDNAGDKGPNATGGSDAFRTLNERMYFWEDINTTDSDTPTNYWNAAYKAIAQANQALVSVEELGGGSDLDYLKGEALMCRAYAHFMLASIFCKAYDPATAASNLGIPYVLEPETVLLGEYERGTLAYVYENIQKDIEEGLPLVEDNYEIPGFHFTRKAANAFASRFYLNIGEWQEVIDHSTVALGGGSGVGEIRDWSSFYAPATYSEQTALYTSSSLEPANLLLVSSASTYSRYHYNARYQMNNSVASALFFDGNITGKSWSFGVYGSSDLYYNIPKFQEYFKVTNQAANTGSAFVTYVLLSTDEALLNRAEAYAMLGQYEDATADINLSLSVKTSGYTSSDELTTSDIETEYQDLAADVYTPYYGISTEALPYVAAVLDIKRTVFYNDGLRWFDLKRHDVEVTHYDYLGNEFVLPKGDNRRAIQIPESAQSFGIEENPR